MRRSPTRIGDYVAVACRERGGQTWFLGASRRPVTSPTRLRVILAPGGSQAIRIRPVR